MKNPNSYYTIEGDGKLYIDEWRDTEIDFGRKSFNNVFDKRREAEDMLKIFKKLLKIRKTRPETIQRIKRLLRIDL